MKTQQQFSSRYVLEP